MNRLTAAAFSTLMAVGAFAGATGSAQADSIEFRFGDDRPRYYRDYVDEGDFEEADDIRPAYGDYGRRCSPWRAEEKARDMGLRRAHVVDVDRRRIVVKGRKWGERQTVVFGRAPHCPVRGVW